MERLFDMVVKPPQNICEKIRKSAKDAFKDSRVEPHISLGSPFYSDRINFMDETERWLETQKPFLFTLRKVENFTTAVYLTSDNQDEIDRFNWLYNGLNQLLSDENVERKKGFNFVPHLTLDRFVYYEDMEKTKARFRRFFANPISIPITNIEIQEKLGNQRWETIDCFKIGTESDTRRLLTVGEYRFSRNNRASIA